MCHPAAIALLTIASAAMTANMQRQQAEAQAQIASENQRVAKWMAEDAVARGRVAEAEHRLAGRGFQGLQTVKLAGQGVALNTGTASDIIASTSASIEYGALKIRANTEREVYGLLTQASQFGFQSGMFSQMGRLQSGATLVGGVASASSQPGLFAKASYVKNT